MPEEERPLQQQQWSRDIQIMRSNEESVETKLQRIAEKAGRDPECRFTSFRIEMEERLNQFGLEVAPEKTKILEFGPQAQKRAKERGERKAETFDFLGLTHYCTTSRSGKTFQVGRKSINKRVIAKLKIYKQWIQKQRTLPSAEIMKTTARKLRGHYAYYRVTGNSRSIGSFAYEVRMLLHKWLGRRGKRGSMSFEKFNLLLKRFPLPTPAYYGEPMVTFKVKRRVLLRSRVRELRKHGSERGVTTTQEEVVMSRDYIVAACSEVYP